MARPATDHAPRPMVERDNPTGVQVAERIGSLDVLRGIALLGMFFVHFRDRSIDPGGGFGHAYQQFSDLFFAGRFATMFAILFGAGFALQLRRAEDRGDHFVPRYLRRLLALGILGFAAEAFFGFSVLLAYAVWGLPLLLLRRASTRTVLALLLLSAASPAIYVAGRALYDTAVHGPEALREDPGLCPRSGIPWTPVETYADTPVCKARWQGILPSFREIGKKTHSTRYGEVLQGRLLKMRLAYRAPNFWLPAATFTPFLIGLLALRLGVFERPGGHKSLVVSAMAFGLIAWAINTWLLPYDNLVPAAAPLQSYVLAGLGRSVLRESWQALAYIGAILLLIASGRVWLRRLAPFALTGRMALTNYILQIIILDVTFSSYALGAKISAVYAPFAAFALFAFDVALCRWWLARFRYGPLEWLWRTATYAHSQSFRRVPQAVAVAGGAPTGLASPSSEATPR
jgi:uncharacterized protein